jgi:hypothetical protein
MIIDEWLPVIKESYVGIHIWDIPPEFFLDMTRAMKVSRRHPHHGLQPLTRFFLN